MNDNARHRIMQIVGQHRGRPNAITRRELDDKLHHFCIVLDDRAFRRIYVTLPLGSCCDGLFVPITNAEVEECREYWSNHMKPEQVAARVGILYSVYPNLVKEFGTQGNLFQPGEART